MLLVVNFNPRPPCGGRPHVNAPVPVGREISIHVLRAEDDLCSTPGANTGTKFQSTSSVRRTTVRAENAQKRRAISIHVLRAEDDGTAPEMPSHTAGFQSTSSVRRTTLATYPNVRINSPISIHVLRAEDDLVPGIRLSTCQMISIHVLRAEDDPVNFLIPGFQPLFQSTSSVRRTTL